MEKVLHVATFVVSSILSQRGELAPEENRMAPEPCTIHDIRLIPENQCDNIIVHRDHVHVSGEVMLNTIREDLPKTFVIGKKLNVTFSEADDYDERFEKLMRSGVVVRKANDSGANLDALAHAAYSAYSDFTGNKNFIGDLMPEWSALPSKIRSAWRAAVECVRDIVLMPVPDPHAPAFKENEKTGTGNPAPEPPNHPGIHWPVTFLINGVNPYEKYRGIFPGLTTQPDPMTDAEIDSVINPAFKSDNDEDIPPSKAEKAAYKRHTGNNWSDKSLTEHYLTDPRGIPPEPNADTDLYIKDHQSFQDVHGHDPRHNLDASKIPDEKRYPDHSNDGG